MKKYFYLLMIGLCLNTTSKAAPGDTTWVLANNVQLTGYGNYDSTITFPAAGTTYRKIYMIFTLGKYMCAGYNPADPGTGAGETGWCGDWDYTVQNYLMTPSGDTFELGRLITPYANALAPRTPWTATQTYVYDVTDYSSALQGSATMRLFFSGYSAGFTGNIQFAFIEGTPDRNVIGISRLWNGSFGYGGTTSINANFSTLSETAPSGTVTTDLKFTVTGHGSDADGCCEFAAHNYQVMLNGTSIASYLIWRDNCGENELYPQSGTWLYRRGNWCPGDMVYSNFHVLTGITAGSSYNIAIQFDPYTSTGGGGSYTTFAALIYYAGINKTLDASIDGIVAPTNDQNYFRENPTSGQPIIQFHNSGSATIDSVTFQYGVQGYAMQTYTWYGTLAPLADTQISLASLPALDTVSGLSGTYGFTAEIVSVNGVADNDQTNDTMRSQFTAAPKWPYSFRIFMYTSNVPSGSSTTLAETSWDILNSDGTVVMQRANCSLNTLYQDTVTLPTGYYQLLVVDSVYDDGSYDGDFYGLNFWGLDGASYTPGYLKVEQATSSATIPMNGYTYSGTYENDWGQQFSQYFYVYNPYSESVQNVTAASAQLDVFPNPAQNMVNVAITGLQQVNGTIQILDALGRVVVQTPCNGANLQINTSGLANGVYNVLFVNENSGNKLQSKLLILK